MGNGKSRTSRSDQPPPYSEQDGRGTNSSDKRSLVPDRRASPSSSDFGGTTTGIRIRP
ncbi:hypothetical protein BDZ89DRAFT_1071141 [Hymenopellis radicata]|nr:hypothetical protein BDZ89DRAFT_1071141 [Hymenopellis radicata]